MVKNKFNNKNILNIAAEEKSRRHALRELKMGELIKRKLSDVFLDSKFDSELLKHLTIAEVRVSPGYVIAKVFITSLNADMAEKKVAELNKKKKQVRFLLAENIELKYIPDLVFVVDEAFETASHIDDLLASDVVKRDIES
jgi:ribosome-binding factor A